VRRILFHKLACKELLDARDYYDDLVFGLGKSFVIEIERCLNIIKANPLAYPLIKENIRKAVVIKFPYSILYSVEKKNIYVLAVMHQKRKPMYWAERM
jgi:plasmid stabilization system protein ParE